MKSKTSLSLSAVILAGGQSRRMGRDKAWLEFDGKPLIQLAVEKARGLGVAEVFISGRADSDYAALGCPVLYDLQPGFGPLSGIERALHECSTPLLLVLAVDLPRMTRGFLKRLTTHCTPLTGAVPKLNGEMEPLVAIYPRRCHCLVREAIIRSRCAARDFAEACLRAQAVQTVPVSAADAGLFANWNEPANLIAKKVFARGDDGTD